MWENLDHSELKPQNAAQSKIIDDVKTMFPENRSRSLYIFGDIVQLQKMHPGGWNFAHMLLKVSSIKCHQVTTVTGHNYHTMCNTQLMYVEMANNCFKKYSEIGSQYSMYWAECVCVYRHWMHLVYILQHSESSSCIICFLSMRTCNNTSKACRPCAVQHLPTRLLQAAVIRFCSRQPQVDAAIHSHGPVFMSRS